RRHLRGSRLDGEHARRHRIRIPQPEGEGAMTSVAPRLDALTALPTLPKAAQLHGWRRTWFRFRQRKSAVVALGFVTVMVLIAVLAPVLAPYDTTEQHLSDRFASFSGKYWLGTDNLGHDALSRMMFGL